MTTGLRDIARLYDIYDVLRLDRSRKVHVCPFPGHPHQHLTPSLGIRVFRDGVQRFHCFGSCGARGDAIDAVGYMQIPFYDPQNGEHVKMAAALLSQGWSPLEIAITAPQREMLDPLLWRQYLPPGRKVIDYATQERGLTIATLSRFRVGEHKGAMTIPAFEDGMLKGIKYRATWKEPKLRFWQEEGSTTALFNYDGVAWTIEPVLIVKGEIPVMLLDQLGFKACCITVGEGYTDVSAWKPQLSFARKLVVVMDNDKDPDVNRRMQAAAREKAQALGAEIAAPPVGYHDIDAWLLADPAAVGEIRAWLDLPIAEDQPASLPPILAPAMSS